MNLSGTMALALLARRLTLARESASKVVNKIRERDAARLDGSLAVSRYIIQCATLARVRLAVCLVSSESRAR